MPTPIRIKRRTTGGPSGAPNSLLQAELAFNETDKILYYGYGIGVGLTAASILSIAGEGAFLAINGNISQTITGTKTFSSPIVGSLSNALSIGAGLSENGTTYDGSAAKSISLPYIGTAGTYGSSTLIPVITTDNYGRVSSVTTSSISTTINLAGNSGTGSVAGGGTLNINGGTGITTNVSGSGVTISIDSTVVTLTGSQTLTNKTLTSPVISTIVNTGTLTLPTSTDTLIGRDTTDTLTNKTYDTAGTGNVFKINGNQISGYTGTGSSVVLSTSPTLTTPTIGAATATSITGASGNLSITAASGNNSVVIAPTGTGAVDVSSKRITNIATPVLASDAVNKAYADSIASSLNIHGAVSAGTTSAVSYTYVSGGTGLTITTILSNVITFSVNHGLKLNSQLRTGDTVSNGLSANTTYYVLTIPDLNQVTISTTPGGTTQTLTDGSGLSIAITGDPGVGAQLTGTTNVVDGYSVSSDDRILVKDHTTAAYNGVYTVTTVGTGADGIWTRATDFDQSPTGEVAAGDYFFIATGTINGGNGWVQTTLPPIRIGIDPITFTQFSGAGQITAGNGLTKSGNTLDVQVDGSTLDIVNDALQIKSTYTGQTSIITLGTIATGTWSATTIAVNKGGTGLASTPTSGQLLIGNSSNGYTLGTLTAGTGITVANASGSITITNTGVTSLDVSGNGISINRSTGELTISTGATSANTASTIVYRDTAGAFSAGAISASSLTVTSPITVPNGGTGVTTFTSKGILYGNGTGVIQVTVAAGTGDSNTTNQILTVDGNGVPVWAAFIDGGTY